MRLTILACLTMLWHVAVSSHYDWSLDINVTLLLEQYCTRFRIGFIVFLIRHMIPSETLKHLTKIGCNFVDIPIDCNQCFSNFIHEYFFYQKLVIIDYSGFTAIQLTYLSRKVNHIFTQCNYKCRLTVLLNGPDFESKIGREMVTNTLVASNSDLRCTLASHSSDGVNFTLASSPILIRPIINGCERLNGFVEPESSAEYFQLTMRPAQCNLNGTTLRTVVNDSKPFCSIKGLKNGTVLVDGFSIEIEMLQMMSHIYNFQVHLINANQDWGELVNGNYTGLIGMLQNKSADVGICIVSSTSARAKVVDFTEWHTFDELNIISQIPPVKNINLIIVRLMSKGLWIALGVSFVLISLVLVLIDFVSTRKPLSVSSIVLVLLQILLNQTTRSFHTNRSTWSNRIMLLFWVLSTLVLTQFFSAQLHSLMQLHEYEHYIETLEELEQAAERDSKYILSINTSYYWHIYTANPEIQLFRKLLLHFERTQVPFVLDMLQGVAAVESDQRKVFIGNKVRIIYGCFIMARKPMHVSRESLQFDFFGITLQKNSPLKMAFDILIDRFRKMGLLIHLQNKLFRTVKLASYENEFVRLDGKDTRLQATEMNPFTTEELHSVLVTLALGLAVATLVLVLELLSAQLAKHLPRFSSPPSPD